MKNFINQIRGLSGRQGPIPGSLLNSITLCLILAVGYFLLGRMAFAMAISEGSATSVAFLPEGLALSFAILFGYRVGPGILLGQLLLSVSLGVPAWVGASFGAINMLEGSLGGWLFWRWKISPKLDRPRDIAMLFGLSALLLQPVAAAAKSIPRLAISPPDTIFHLSLYSWAGNTMGQILIAPLILAWCSSGFRWNKREMTRGLLIVSAYFVGILIFKVLKLEEIDQLYWLAIFAAFYLVLIGNAVRCRTLTTSLINLLTTMGLLWVTTSSPGSLLYFSTQDRVLYADILVLGGVLTALLLSALFGQLGERTIQLEQANVAKERIFTVIGHDLRNPILSLTMALKMLKTKVIDQEGFLEFQDSLQNGVEQARWTLENLMEWGGLQLNELQPQPTAVILEKSATETLDLLELQAKSKNIQIENRIPEHAKVWADPHQVDSIFRNLISNALKFSHENGLVTLEAESQPNQWTVSVTDRGMGMSEEKIATLLARPLAHDSSQGTAKERGLGLGLRITMNFIDANHGRLVIQSTPGVGSVFQFTLPVPVNSSVEN